ncbi:MAG: hypothetical protein SGI87_08390 [Flavobacteriales bacterium]|nr:hypothetical protein [Flavobacteriales bacterium]
MQKTIAIALGLIYLLLSSGIQIHQHYCCGKLKEVSFTGVPDHCCATEHGSCSISKKCCDIRELNFKIDDVHQIRETLQTSGNPIDIKVHEFVPLTTQVEMEVASLLSNANAPPNGVNLYTMHCALIVYG